MKEVRPENSGRGIWYLNCLFASYVLDSKGFSNSFAFCSRGAVAPGLPCHRQSLRDKPVTPFSVYILTHPPSLPTQPTHPCRTPAHPARPIMGFRHRNHALVRPLSRGLQWLGKRKSAGNENTRGPIRKSGCGRIARARFPQVPIPLCGIDS